MLRSNISSLDPPYNSTISLGTNSLEIVYNTTVTLSVGNVSIYQVNGDDVIMRQSISGLIGEFYSISPDFNKISIKVLLSTFNQPNKEYFVWIKTNFVKQNGTNEPIDGLQALGWRLLTGNYYFYN